MILTRTPFRISFMGGGSDYKAWYEQHGGAVLACSIDKYCYLSARWRPAYFNEKSRVVWSEIELVNSHAEIHHPAVRAVLEHLWIEDGIEIHHFADLPSKTGLGSSSAFTVGLLAAIRALNGEAPGAAELAAEAIHVEQKVMHETVGIQDQIQTAHGGLNFVRISPEGEYTLRPLVLSRERLADFQNHLMLFYTGEHRHASKIAASQVEQMSAGKSNDELVSLSGMARRGADILSGEGELVEFGLMLHEAWELKKRLSPLVTTATVDAMYQAARDAGATGGKLLGAGGGGFVLIFASPRHRADVQSALSAYLEVPFRIEYQGAQVIYRG